MAKSSGAECLSDLRSVLLRRLATRRALSPAIRFFAPRSNQGAQQTIANCPQTSAEPNPKNHDLSNLKSCKLERKHRALTPCILGVHCP